MYTLPCCPRCHCRFPAGWSKADDFGAILLMAPTGGGKTTYMCSLMRKDWQALNSQLDGLELNGAAGGRVEISPAYYNNGDAEYKERQKQADRIASEGVCPEPTRTTNWIYPVFLNVYYNGHVMILGIYDNAGEKLTELDLLGNQDLRIITSEKVIADLFLFDPEHLYIDGVARDQKSNSDNKWFDQCKVLPIEEQAALQSQNKGKSRRGEDLWKESNPAKHDQGGQCDLTHAFSVYNRYLQLLRREQKSHLLRGRYFEGIIIKCDKLMTKNMRDGTDGLNEDYAPLFENRSADDGFGAFNPETIKARSSKIRRIIEEKRFFGLPGSADAKSIESFENVYGDNTNAAKRKHDPVTWSFVSATGCLATKENEDAPGKLEGEYKPIRIADPLADCIVKHIADLGWI